MVQQPKSFTSLPRCRRQKEEKERCKRRKSTITPYSHPAFQHLTVSSLHMPPHAGPPAIKVPLILTPDFCISRKFGAEAAGHPTPLTPLMLCRTTSMASARTRLVAGESSAASLLNDTGSSTKLPAAIASRRRERKRSRSGGHEQGIKTISAPVKPSHEPGCCASRFVLGITPNEGTRSGFRSPRPPFESGGGGDGDGDGLSGVGVKMEGLVPGGASAGGGMSITGRVALGLGAAAAGSGADACCDACCGDGDGFRK